MENACICLKKIGDNGPCPVHGGWINYPNRWGTFEWICLGLYVLVLVLIGIVFTV